MAGGAGRRAGAEDKLLVRDGDGRPMLLRTLASLQASRLEPVVLVLGHAAAARQQALEASPGAIGSASLRVMHAPDHAEGIAASLRCGIAQAVREGWQAAMICLGDMPLVTAGVLDRLLEAYRSSAPQPDAVVPLAGGRRGNPVLWRRAMFPQLLALRGDQGARAVLDRPGTQVLGVEIGDPGVLADFDTPARLALFAADRGRGD